VTVPARIEVAMRSTSEHFRKPVSGRLVKNVSAAVELQPTDTVVFSGPAIPFEKIANAAHIRPG
jgi:hypothetical protein